MDDNLPQFGKGLKLGGSDEYFPYEFSREYKELLEELVSTDLRPESDQEKLEFWRKETGVLIKKEKINPAELRKRLGLVTEISPEEVLLSRRVLAIKKMRKGLNPQGLAETPDAQRECLRVYNDAFNYFIKRIREVLEVSGMSVKIVLRGIVGSLAEGNARLGIHPVGVSYKEASNENFALKRREQRGVEFPSDIDLKVVLEMPKERLELSSLIDQKIEKLAEDVFMEYGVFIQVDRHDVRNAVPMEEIEKKGGLYEFYIKKQKEMGE